jgi:hypothetical protein
MLKRPMLLGAALAVLLSSSASAAVTLEPLQSCYVAAQPDQLQLVGVNVHGLTPSSTADVFVDEIASGTATASLDGEASGTVRAPYIPSGERPFTVRVTEHDAPLNTVTAMSRVTAFRVTQTPKSAKTTQRVRFRGRGFTQPYKYVFAHYVFAGKSKKTVQLAYPQGACGTFNVKRLQFPFKHRPTTGSWTIQFDQEPIYNPMASAQVRMTIKVKRAPKGSRGR